MEKNLTDGPLIFRVAVNHEIFVLNLLPEFALHKKFCPLWITGKHASVRHHEAVRISYVISL